MTQEATRRRNLAVLARFDNRTDGSRLEGDEARAHVDAERAARGETAADALADVTVTRVEIRMLLNRMWTPRDRCGGYDAVSELAYRKRAGRF